MAVFFYKLPVMVDTPPNYESYDYSKVWDGKRLNDLAEKAVIGSWTKHVENCLELGSGQGRITPLLQTRCRNVVCVDYSKYNLQVASRALKVSPFFIKSVVETLPCRDSFFDLVIMIRVAHHLPHPSLVMDEIYRVAKDRGTLIISIPNPILSKARRSASTIQTDTGEFGHKIYSTPYAAFSRTGFLLLERKGTGIFENKLGAILERFPYLHLADTLTSPIWFTKKQIFIRFEIRK